MQARRDSSLLALIVVRQPRAAPIPNSHRLPRPGEWGRHAAVKCIEAHYALAYFQVDAFTDRVFDGNPAAVCPLDYWYLMMCCKVSQRKIRLRKRRSSFPKTVILKFIGLPQKSRWTYVGMQLWQPRT